MILRPIPQALAQTRRDLDRVMRKDQPPLLTSQAMLGLLQLDGPNPDGKSLAGRLLHSNNLLDKVLPPTGESMNALRQTLVFTGHLLGKLAEYGETDFQHAEAENLVTVAERQITREQNICPIATDLYLRVGSKKPEMVNRSVYVQLAFQSAMGNMMKLVSALARTGKGGVQIIEIRTGPRN